MKIKSAISIGLPFNQKLQTFLFNLGYTHVYNAGCTIDEQFFGYTNAGNYYMIPLPAGHLLLNEQHNPQIMEMLSVEVCDMANEVVDNLNFIMNLPVDVYENFINQ